MSAMSCSDVKKKAVRAKLFQTGGSRFPTQRRRCFVALGGYQEPENSGQTETKNANGASTHTSCCAQVTQILSVAGGRKAAAPFCPSTTPLRQLRQDRPAAKRGPLGSNQTLTCWLFSEMVSSSVEFSEGDTGL